METRAHGPGETPSIPQHHANTCGHLLCSLFFERTLAYAVFHIPAVNVFSVNQRPRSYRAEGQASQTLHSDSRYDLRNLLLHYLLLPVNAQHGDTPLWSMGELVLVISIVIDTPPEL